MVRLLSFFLSLVTSKKTAVHKSLKPSFLYFSLISIVTQRVFGRDRQKAFALLC